jgi:pyruvate,orthophosphate dikinase
MATSQYVYSFGPQGSDGDASMSDLLGGKGANLAEMARLGLPVPPGFTITTEVCTAFLSEDGKFPDGLENQVKAAMAKIAAHIGDDAPVLVSVRSGGRVSMPGMMDTVLNLGLNTETVARLAQSSGDERFAWDSYRRFIQMYGDVVMDVPHDYFEEILDDYKLDNGLEQDSDLQAQDWQKIVELYRDCIVREAETAFPDDPEEQIWGAIKAVFQSWNNARAQTYRRLHAIPDEWGTAVTVQAMVFGNLGETSATGVCFTRNPSTGEKELYGEFLPNAQGEDVVAGIRTPYYLSTAARTAAQDVSPALEELMPDLYAQLCQLCANLEMHFRDMQDIEFTIQQNKLFVLQTRSGKRTTQAGLKIAVDLHHEGLLSKDEALLRIDPTELDRLLHPTLDDAAVTDVLTRGLPASPGAACGKVVFSADAAEAAKAQGEDVILVRMETSPEDIHGMYAAAGILTSRGGMTSHAAVVARGLGRACVSGATALHIDFEAQKAQIGTYEIKAGDTITIDGSTGRVIAGQVAMREPELTGDFATLMSWADARRSLNVRANAETVLDARMARKFGAEGIGLCRTEHMFFDPERILLVRQMILASDAKQRIKFLAQLQPFQEKDFVALFEVMEGLPITIRLLDPPLHEFLPRRDDEIENLAMTLGESVATLKARLRVLHEENPMLGHRGCRLAVTMPEIYEMQIDAIFAAMTKTQYPAELIEIMIPLTVSAEELGLMRDLLSRRQAAFGDAARVAVKFGTMIETPRAALMAAQLAPLIDFASFGSNDLTQMTMGLSRDDAAGFLDAYVRRALVPSDPFVHIDEDGVGQLIELAVAALRHQKHVKIGLCGEHGGDPESIRFLAKMGLDYVSCSPYRLPIARLAAAQAAILG